MSSFPRSPRLLRGAILSGAFVIPFQYNPERLSRSISANPAGGDGSQGEALRLKGPPIETLGIDIELDATDQLEGDQPTAKASGIAPMLASLEVLLYPLSARMILNEALARVGIIEVIPPEVPLTLFVWGPRRVLPVRLTALTVTEQAFDTSLNPIRATVALSLRVLSYQDLGLLSIGGGLSMIQHVMKEAMAVEQSSTAVRTTLPRIFSR